MSMSQAQFDQIVERLEQEAISHPVKYRIKVALWSALGYGFIGLLLLFAVSIVVFLVLILMSGKTIALVIKFGWVALIFLYFIVRSLWVSFPKPEGILLRLEENPQLSTMIKGLEESLETPPFHQVLLTPDFNASVYQRPRLGIFGWQQNYLMLGLPLMCALSPEQMRAVVAHEFGHLSANHSRFAGWIYRLRSTWASLMETIEAQGGSGKSITERFFHWYIPRFNALTFALARSDEYAADALSAQVIGRDHFGQALINVKVLGHWYSDNFWEDYFKQGDASQNPFLRMNQSLRYLVDKDTGQHYLSNFLARATDTTDTHPSLSDRLRAIGYFDDLRNQREDNHLKVPPPPEETAADHYLGGRLPLLAQELILLFDWDSKTAFAEFEQRQKESHEELGQLEEKAKQECLSEEELIRLARLQYELGYYEKTIPYLEQLLHTDPDHDEANFLKGAIYLKHHQDAAGIEFIEKTMARDHHAISSGCHLIYDFLMEKGRKAEAQRYRHRAVEHLNKVEEARKEREFLNIRNRFSPHSLSELEVDAIRSQLLGIPEIKSVYLVQKVLEHFPEEPMFVLGARLKFRLTLTGKRVETVGQQIAQTVETPHHLFIIVLDDNHRAFEKKFKRIPGSRIIG